MRTETLYHGGPMTSEWPMGVTFWTRKAHEAVEYADDGELYTLTIDWDTETIEVEDDFLPERGYWACDSNEENFAMQTQAIADALAAGATVVMCNDGIVILGVERLDPRPISVDDALEIE